MPTGIDTAPGVFGGFDALGAPSSFWNNVMTNLFLPTMGDARNNSSVLWNMVNKVTHESTSGKFIVWPIRTTRNTGRGAMRPGGQLSDPGSQGAATAFTEPRTYVGRIKVDGETMRRAKTNGGAFLDAVSFEMEGQLDDIMVDYNRLSHNDGSGRLAEINAAAAASTSIVVRINQSIEGASSCPTRPTLWLEVGDRIGFYNPAGDALRANGAGQTGFYVVSIVDASTVTIATSPGGSAINSNTITGYAVGDWVVRVNAEGATASPIGAKSSGARNEMMGIGGIFSDAGTLDGLAAAGLTVGASQYAQQTGANDFTATSNASAGFQGNACTAAQPWNRAVVLDNGVNGARTLTEELLQQSFSDAEEQNNALIGFMLSSYATYNSYVRLLTPDKRFNDTLELKGGHKALSFNGVAWYKDRFCYGGRVYMLNMDVFSYMETQPLQPLAAQGLPAWERLKDFDAYWMGHVTSGNLAVTDIRQRVGAVLVDLAA